jgi:hypothetical protein
MKRTPHENMNGQWKNVLRRYGLVGLIYLLATFFTDAFFMGDTADYVESVIIGLDFWEFGHLFWRPLGWLLFQVFQTPVSWIVGASIPAQVAAIFIAITWVSGLLSVFLLHSLSLRFAKQQSVATFITIAFIFSQGFLNFSQTGSSYIPGLSFLLLGFYLLLTRVEKNDSSWKTAIWSGLALAVAVCLWFPYVWAIPAALAAPLLIAETRQSSWRLVLRTVTTFSLITSFAYVWVILHLGIHDLTGLHAWVTSSSHGMKLTGIARTILGFVRSIINLGNDGIAFKRFTLNDPYAPISGFDLLRVSVWKLGLFYLIFAALLFSLVRSERGKRFLALIFINAIPLFGFAFFFDGGSVERYLPLFPVLFLSAAFCFSEPKTPRYMRVAAIIFICIFSVTNLRVMNLAALSAQQQLIESRIDAVHSQLTPRSKLFVISQQDELINFNRTFFFNPVNQDIGAITSPVLLLNTTQVDRWQVAFAEDVATVWKAGGEAWLSSRLFSASPAPEWNWVEGADQRIAWRDLHSFFVQLEVGEVKGEKDGFVRLLNTETNKHLLSGILLAKQEGKQSLE